MTAGQACPFVLLLLTSASPADEVDTLLRDVTAVRKEASGAGRAREAWHKLVQQGPAVLPRILRAMDTPDTVIANWLRTAFERIVEEAKEKHIHLDSAPLVAFAAERQRQGRARRLALELAEELKPGSRAQLLKDAVADPEFRYDAIEKALEELRKQAPPEEKARLRYRELFEASRDQDQGRRIAAGLKGLDLEVSLATHMGFLRQWYAIGPFDGNGMKGFQTQYPPEKSVDLKQTLPGKGGKELTWKPLEAREAWTGRFQALADLRPVLGDATDAVAYAFTTIKVKEAREVEFRGAADDNLMVWVNGDRVFGFEEYRNGVRLDRHRFKVKLRARVNAILVKVGQAPADGTHTELNWEFLLRICDETGKGIAFDFVK